MRWVGQRFAGRLNRCGLAQRSLLPLLALLVLVHVAYSVTPDLRPDLRNLAFLAGSVLLVALLAAASSFWRPGPIRELSAAPVEGATPSDALFALVMIASAAYFSLPNRLAVPLIAAFGTIQAVILVMRRRRWSLIVSCFCLLLGLGLAVSRVPLDRLGGDMLPVTVWADNVFLHGLNPYFEDYTSVTPGPFYYLPLQWLIYLPFVVLHLDLRLLNEIAVLGTLGMFLLLWREISFPWTGFAVLLGLIASRPSTEMVYQGEVWPLWCMISVFAFLVHRRRSRMAALVLGLLLACSQISLAIAALFGAYQLRSAASWRETFLLAGIATAVYLAFVFPFAHGLVSFITEYYIVVPHLAGIMSERRFHNSITQVSLVNVLTRARLPELRAWLQVAAGVTGMAVLVLRRRTTPAQFLTVCGLTYLWAISLNVQVWKYYYIPGLLLLFWGIYAPRTDAAQSAVAVRP